MWFKCCALSFSRIQPAQSKPGPFLSCSSFSLSITVLHKSWSHDGLKTGKSLELGTIAFHT